MINLAHIIDVPSGPHKLPNPWLIPSGAAERVSVWPSHPSRRANGRRRSATRIAFGVVWHRGCVPEWIDAGLDLYPTICDLARVTAPQGLRGLSILPLLEGRQSTWRKNLICETEFASNAGGMGIRGRAVRDNRYKYVCYSEGGRREQLFDLLKDPGESLNLIAVPEMAERLRGFRESLADWCRGTGDNFPVPGTSP